MSGGSGKFYITGDIIYGPKDNGRFFIAGNYIYGPRNSGKYYLRGDNLYGPTSSAKWSLRDGYFPSSRSNRHRPISIYCRQRRGHQEGVVEHKGIGFTVVQSLRWGTGFQPFIANRLSSGHEGARPNSYEGAKNLLARRPARPQTR